MGKQPYIPFYLGDYLKDTRILPLNVRGGWVDLILYMWDNNPKGELLGTYDDFARLMTCSKDEAILVIQTLNQKKIFDYAELENGVMKIQSRKIKEMIRLSEIRKKAGKEGGNPNLVKQTKKRGKPKPNQKPEIESEYKNEINNNSEIILPYQTEKFKFTWSKWLQYRKEINHPYKSPLSQQAALKTLSKHSEQIAIEMIEQSIANSWQGIFDIKNNGKPTKQIGSTPEELRDVANYFRNKGQ